MISIFSVLVSILVIVPFIGYLIIFIVSKLITGEHRKSVHIALDVSTFLFILSVHFLIITIWNKSYFWVVLLFMLFEAVVFVVFQWKIKHEIDFKKVFKGYWRMNFLVFFSVYVLLMLFGIIQSITKSVM